MSYYSAIVRYLSHLSILSMKWSKKTVPSVQKTFLSTSPSLYALDVNARLLGLLLLRFYSGKCDLIRILLRYQYKKWRVEPLSNDDIHQKRWWQTCTEKMFVQTAVRFDVCPLKPNLLKRKREWDTNVATFQRLSAMVFVKKCEPAISFPAEVKLKYKVTILTDLSVPFEFFST